MITTQESLSRIEPLTLSREYLAGFLDGAMHIFLMNKRKGFPSLSLTVRCQSGVQVAQSLVATFACGHIYVDTSPSNEGVLSCRWRVLAVSDVHMVLRRVAPDLVVLRSAVDVALEIADQFTLNTVLRRQIREQGGDILLERELREGVLHIYELEAKLEAAKRGTLLAAYDDERLQDSDSIDEPVPYPGLRDLSLARTSARAEP